MVAFFSPCGQSSHEPRRIGWVGSEGRRSHTIYTPPAPVRAHTQRRGIAQSLFGLAIHPSMSSTSTSSRRAHRRPTRPAPVRHARRASAQRRGAGCGRRRRAGCCCCSSGSDLPWSNRRRSPSVAALLIALVHPPHHAAQVLQAIDQHVPEALHPAGVSRRIVPSLCNLNHYCILLNKWEFVDKTIESQ